MLLSPFQLEPLYSSRLPTLSSTPPPLQFVIRQHLSHFESSHVSSNASHITVHPQPATVQNAPKCAKMKYSKRQIFRRVKFYQTLNTLSCTSVSPSSPGSPTIIGDIKPRSSSAEPLPLPSPSFNWRPLRMAT